MVCLLQELVGRAARSRSALAVYNGQDGIISVNRRHRSLYPFIDFSKPIDYPNIAMECVKHRKLDESSIYKAPDRWIAAHARFRYLNRFSQTLTRHSDGRIVQVTYERLEGTNGCWYQMRRDVTAEVLRCIRDGLDPLAQVNAGQAVTPPVQTAFMVRLLDRISHPAVLLTRRAQIVDGNIAFAKLLARGDGLVLNGGRLDLRTSPESRQAFAKSIAGFHRRRKRTPLTLRTGKPDRRPFYLLTLSEPPTEQLGWDTSASDILLLTVTEPDALLQIESRIIADLLQISETEARVAQALAAGRATREIAVEHEMSREAIDSQMASILNKTGFRDLAAVTRQVTTLSYVFGPRI